MSSSTSIEKPVEINVENVAGIEKTSVSFTPGVTILAGRNATNRTSLLQAVMAAHGSTNASVKADADAGTVTLTIGDDSYECTLSRDNGTVTLDGDPYLEDTTVADLFAFLLEDNEARRAVERGDDLRELIMRPVDTDELQAEIRELEAEKDQIDDELAELDELKRQLPDLEEERTRIADQLEAKRDELEAREAELEQADASVEEKRQTKDKLDAKLDELRDTRSALEDARYELETKQDTLESLREERAELQSEYESLSETPAADIEEIERRLDDLHDRKQAVTADLTQIQTIVQFNEELLDDAAGDILTAIGDTSAEHGDGALTDKLVDDEQTVTCWTCGSAVQESSIEEMVEELREFRQRKLQEKRDIEADIDELQAKHDDLQSQQRRHQQLERDLSEYDDEIEQAEAAIEDLEARVTNLEVEVEDLEATVEELEDQEHSELLALHKKISQLEVDIEQLEEELESLTGEIETIEERLEERSSLESRREAVQSDLEERRTTVDRLEQNAVDQFNEHMAALIEELGFENLERVWLERRAQASSRPRDVEGSTFELHVVRATDDGTVYEDTVDNLSESEREVVGLVFSLAGYLVHDVHESVPFVLLDSLEAIDSERIAALVDYFADYAECLLVALLPEDAAALDDSYTRIREI